MSTLVNPIVGAKILASDLGSYYNLLKGIGGSGDLITQFYKGANIASAATLTIGADGNYFQVSGTTTITAISSAPAGTEVCFRFLGILTLTYNVTTLTLGGAANVTTAAGDMFTFISEGSGNWRETARATLASGASGGTPALVLGTANTAGVAATFIRTDDTILAFDATVPAAIGTAAAGATTTAARRSHVHPTGAGTPSTQAFSDAAAIGTGPAAAMTDHKHGMMAAPAAAFTVTAAMNQASADVLLASGATWYTGASLSLSASAKYIATGVITFTSGQGGEHFEARLWDGTTTFASTESWNIANGTAGELVVTGYIVTTGAVTLSLQGLTNGGAGASNIKSAAPTTGVGNNATTLVATRIS